MTPRTPSQFREIREEKKSLLMDVALRHFASEGYHNTTISKIARQAGISKGSFTTILKVRKNFSGDHQYNHLLEMGRYFDPFDNEMDILSEKEFELFIRKLFWTNQGKTVVLETFLPASDAEGGQGAVSEVQ